MPPRQATFKDIRSDSSDNDDDKRPDLYAGGHASGMAIQPNRGPQESDPLVDRILESARQAALQADHSEDESPKPMRAFQGAGRTMADSENVAPPTSVTNSENTKPKRRKAVLTFWKEGFSIDDGPLRGYEDPQEKQLLETILAGYSHFNL
jgi:UBX domain-containing protein 1